MHTPPITITLKINHALAPFVPRHMVNREMHISVKRGATVAYLLKEIVGLSKQVKPLVLVNGRHAQARDQLNTGDRVTVWMPMAGG